MCIMTENLCFLIEQGDTFLLRFVALHLTNINLKISSLCLPSLHVKFNRFFQLVHFINGLIDSSTDLISERVFQLLSFLSEFASEINDCLLNFSNKRDVVFYTILCTVNQTREDVIDVVFVLPFFGIHEVVLSFHTW